MITLISTTNMVNTFTKVVSRLSILLLAMVLIGCSSPGAVKFTSELDAKGNPLWVKRGTNTIKTNQYRLFHGVGFADITADFTKGTYYADKNAKDALADLLDDYFETVSRHYLASDLARSAGFTQRMGTNDLEQFSKLKLSSATVVGHWKNIKQNTIYSVAQFDFIQLKHAVAQIDNLSLGFRGYFDREAAKIFDHMASREDL